MEKNQIVILEDRGTISVSGPDSEDFLQNILTNDVGKVAESNSIFSAIFTPQGKYLYEFFVIKSKNGYFLDCDNEFTEDIIENLSKYKIRSNYLVMGWTDTEGELELRNSQGMSQDELKDMASKIVPMGRMLNVNDPVPSVMHLLSD